MKCPYCSGNNTIKKGTRNGKQRYKCLDCKKRGKSYWFFQHIDYVATRGKAPKVLVMDIETLPIQAYVWDVWNTNVNSQQIIKDSCVLSWAAKWLYDGEIVSDILTPQEALDRDDSRIAEGIWKLHDEADFVVAYNGLGFDFKHLQSAWIKAELPPPSFYRTIDPFPIVKSYFKFTYNKMDYISKKLGLKRKIATDFQLWADCSEGDKQALKNMLEYNEHDILVLEDVYLKFRPWIINHPNIGLYHDSNERVCKFCGSTHITDLKDKFYYTNASKFQIARCDDCTGISRYPSNLLSKVKRSNLMK